jgi:hypothetical protein
MVVAWQCNKLEAPARASAVACCLNNRICLTAPGDAHLSMHIAADGAEHWISVTAGMAGAVPSSRTGHSLCSDSQGRAIVFGGKSSDAASSSMCNDAYIADVPAGLEKIQWRQLGANAEPLPAVDPKDLPKGRKASATQPAVAVSPQPRAWHAACTVRRDGSWYMLVHGGIAADGTVLADTWLYNLAAESWVQLNPAAGASPPAAAHHTLTSLDEGKRALLLGGYDGSRHSCTAAVLTLKTQTWIVCEDLGLPPLCMHAAGAVPTISSDCFKPLPSQEVATDLSKQRLVLWGMGAVALTPTAAASGKSGADATLQVTPESASEAAETVLVYGGCTASGASAAVYALTPDCRAYVVKAINTGAAPAARHSAAAAVIGSKLYVTGGADGSGKRLLDVAVLDTASSCQELGSRSRSDSVHALSATDSSATAAAAAATAAQEPVRYANGDVYTGALDAAGLRSGSGEMRYANGNVYSGEWQSDSPSFGEMQYAAASVDSSGSNTDAITVLQCYSGAWEGGKPCGKGQGTFSSNCSGATFTGRWLDGLPHGPGTRDSPQGLSVEGLWEQGVLVHGKETLQQQQHQQSGGAAEVYEGAFKSNARHGAGRCVYADGSVYDGEWRAGRRNGQGTYTDAVKQEVYKGKWVGGVRCGRGSCAYAAGHKYEGHWLQGRRHGLGCMRYASGDVYEGEWQQGHRGGEGVLTQASGLVLKGAWVQDELQTALSSSVAG